MDINELIRQKCREKRITVRRLEQELGFSNGYIQNMKKPIKNYERAKLIADALEIPVNWLLQGVDNDIPAESEKAPKTPDFRPVMDYIVETHGQGTADAVRMLLELDAEDSAEIRGEMRAMLRMQKYADGLKG